VSVPGSDAALINAIRSGDPGAYDVLRSRHGAAARRLASHLPRGRATVNDVVDWAFVQVLEAIRRGGGPTDAFRPYLLTAVQRATRDCAAGESSPIPTDDQDIPDPGQLMTGGPAGNGETAGADGTAGNGGGAAGTTGATGPAAVAAFMSLPERWRAVLWHTEIEDAAPAAVASLFGLGAADAADLAARAREGMAQNAGIEPDGVHAVLRHAVAPAVLGTGAAGYLTELAYTAPTSPARTDPGRGGPDHGPAGADLADPPASPAGPLVLGAPVAAAGLAGPGPATASAKPPAPPGSSAAARWQRASSRQRNTVTGAAVLLVILAIVGYALTLSPGAGPVTAAPSRPATTPVTPGPASYSPVPAPSATPTPSTAPAAVVPVAANTAGPAQAPPPAVRLTATVSMAEVVGFGRLADVNFTVTNIGSATSAVLTARVSVPPGVNMTLGAGLSDGWTCGPADDGATCSHQPLAAGTGATDTLTVLLTSASACGQPVELTVTGRSAQAAAATPVRCGNPGHEVRHHRGGQVVRQRGVAEEQPVVDRAE
jgi:DNA-directed RNA polymerase specialized sigma24 family protein